MKRITCISTKTKKLLISTFVVGSALLAGATMTAAQEIDSDALDNETSDLGDYPEPFIEEDELNSVIVVGEDVQNTDIESSMLIHESLKAAGNESEQNPIQENRYNHFGLINNDYSEDDLPDTVITENEYQGEDNVILIGGPEANVITADLAQENLTMVSEDYEEGQATIQLIPEVFNDEYHALVVAGETAEDTQIAAQVLTDYEDFEDEMIGSQQLIIDTEEEEVIGTDDPEEEINEDED